MEGHMSDSQHHNGSTPAIVRAALANVGIAVIKFIGGFLTGSSAMISEGIHSLVDTFNQGLLAHGQKMSRKSPDSRHPMGYGKVIYVNSLVVSVLVFVVGGLLSAIKGIEALMAGEDHLVSVDIMGLPISMFVINVSILAFSLLCEGWAFYAAYQEFRPLQKGRSVLTTIRETKDPTIIVLILEDGAALLGLSVAMTGIVLAHYTSIWQFDAIASMVISLILFMASGLLFWKTRELLLGECAEKPVNDRILSIIKAMPEVLCVNELMALHYGPFHMIVTVSLDMRDQINGRLVSSHQIEVLSSKLDREIKNIINDEFSIDVVKVFIEAQGNAAHLKIETEDVAANQ